MPEVTVWWKKTDDRGLNTQLEDLAVAIMKAARELTAQAISTCTGNNCHVGQVTGNVQAYHVRAENVETFAIDTHWTTNEEACATLRQLCRLLHSWRRNKLPRDARVLMVKMDIILRTPVPAGCTVDFSRGKITAAWGLAEELEGERLG